MTHLTKIFHTLLGCGLLSSCGSDPTGTHDQPSDTSQGTTSNSSGEVNTGPIGTGEPGSSGIATSAATGVDTNGGIDATSETSTTSGLETSTTSGLETSTTSGLETSTTSGLETSTTDGETDDDESCQTILQADPSATSGVYLIDADGLGGMPPFDVFCEMVIDGGGWTLVASFVNDDGSHSWTQWQTESSNLENWRNDVTFGSVLTHETADHKSAAFTLVSGADLLAVDDSQQWARFAGVLGEQSLRDRIVSEPMCTSIPTLLPNSPEIAASDAGAIPFLMLGFYGGDPNQAQSCAFNNIPSQTDSAVLYMVADSCGTQGFGQLGWFNSATTINYDSDSTFCLAAPPYSAAPACGDYPGVGVGSRWGCNTNASFLYVR